MTWLSGWLTDNDCFGEGGACIVGALDGHVDPALCVRRVAEEDGTLTARPVDRQSDKVCTGPPAVKSFAQSRHRTGVRRHIARRRTRNSRVSKSSYYFEAACDKGMGLLIDTT